MSADAAGALVRSLPRTTLVVGKGGVGKTTCAAALALRMSDSEPTLVLSTDPARALPSVLAATLGGEPGRVPATEQLYARTLDTGELRSRFLDRWGTVIRAILDRGTYLDETDIGPLVDTALPGGDEIFSALALAELLAERQSRFARIVVDTAPTGHTLRLLQLPRTFRALVSLLDAMQEKHRFLVRALTRAYRGDDADAFLKEMGRLVSALEATLRDPSRCAAVVVTNAQPLVVEETRRFLADLGRLGVPVGAVVSNASDEGAPLETTAPRYLVPRLSEWPVGVDGLRRWLKAAVSREPGAGSKRRRARTGVKRASSQPPVPGSRLPAALRSLTIVAGKGGVGKSTVACAFALTAATGRRTLVVSTDPAPSLGDALAQDIGDEDTPVAGETRLFARQMDASAAFARLRAEYQSRVDAMFTALIARGVDLAHDRAIARDLLSLAPPGVDEVYALSLLADALFGDRYECVIVDPAPTGHLLRLLDMPQVALSWTHQIMRLMLKYKDVAGLGETARELLDFSKNLRAVDALLRDAERCGVVLVTLEEPVVRAESVRLAAELRARGVAVSGVVRNRVENGAALPVVESAVQLEAPLAEPPPVGLAALREWSLTWRETVAPARTRS